MRSLKDYNKVANENTKRRKDVTDWSDWGATIAEESKSLIKQDRIEANHHLCMIVGYNEASEELAVSDSWGASFERRWVPLGVAAWASSGGLFMILP